MNSVAQLHPSYRPVVKARQPDKLASDLYEPLQDPLNAIFAASTSALLMTFLMVVRPDLLDWILVPLFLCGVLSGIDMVGYLRGKLDTFDPLGVLGLFGYYFFFVAPLLTLATGYHSKFLPQVVDYSDWIGWLCAMNSFGLFLYLTGRQIFRVRKPKTVWVVLRPSFFTAISIALPVTLACQILIFVRYGGIFGFMQAFTDRDVAAFSGMGYLFLTAEMFPVFFGIAFLVWKRDSLRRRSWIFLALLTGAFFVLKLICGGLRGSRSITMWGVFWMVGAIHVWIRPVSRKLLAVGLIFVLLFLYLYGFYKDVGVAAFDIISDPGKIEVLENNSGRSIYSVFLGDMARTEIQATVLSRVKSSPDFQYAYGMTYLQAFAFTIPVSIWPDRPEGKVQVGTEALFGRGSYNKQLLRATYIYGLMGEAMLNFSPMLAPLAFLLLAFIMSKLRSLMLADSDDLRLLLMPVACFSGIMLVSADLDNVLFAAISIAIAPVIMIRSCCCRVSRTA
jgi:hypothetical protein